MKWLHDLAGLSLAGIVRYHPDKQQVLQALVQRCDPVALMRCQDALQQLAPFGQHTLNTRLQLEALLMDYPEDFCRWPTRLMRAVATGYSCLASGCRTARRFKQQ
jgi:DNA polymerase-3 subunit delta'